jgi:hypothetical protein
VKKVKWPHNKKFAFTVVDDTDFSTVDNTKPIYDFLYDMNIKTTKTVWVYPSKDRYSGSTLSDEDYLNFILNLQKRNFEIALHGVGSGDFNREEILKGLKLYKDLIGIYPKIHINHAQNPHNIYHGNRAGSKLLQAYAKLKSPSDLSFGHELNSNYFWGDFAKNHIKYIRGRVYNEINTLNMDKRFPYIDEEKKYSNYWFSSSDGANVFKFNNLLKKENVDKLETEQGLCIVYTHFASGFVEKNGELNEDFKKVIKYLANKNGWFAPASTILDYLISSQERGKKNSQYRQIVQDLKVIFKKKLGK